MRDSEDPVSSSDGLPELFVRQEGGGIGVNFGFSPFQLQIVRSEWARADSRKQMSSKAGLIFRGKLIRDLNGFNKCLHGSKIANQGCGVNF